VDACVRERRWCERRTARRWVQASRLGYVKQDTDARVCPCPVCMTCCMLCLALLALRAHDVNPLCADHHTRGHSGGELTAGSEALDNNSAEACPVVMLPVCTCSTVVLVACRSC
jgi:hypothetical protein